MQAPDNPYFHWGPIRDPRYFYNRDKEIRQVLKATSNRQCISLVGLRKMGKTSLLFRLRALNEGRLLSLEEGCVYIYIDGQAYQRTGPSEFYFEVLDEVCTVLTQRGKSILPVEEPKEGIRFRDFRRAIRSLVHRRLRPVILIDEFDSLCENHDFDLAFFTGLRSLATLGVAYVTAGKRRLSQLNREKEILGSPFFNYFQTLYIGLFDEESALKLIREPSTEFGVRFAEQTVAEVFRLGGRHPFFLQQVCYIAFDMRHVQEEELSKQDAEQVWIQSKQALEDQMASYWKDLGPEEQQILLSISGDQGLQQDSEVTLDNLVRQGLLLRSNCDYEVFSALFRDYVRAQPHPKRTRPQRWLDRFQDWKVLGQGRMSVVYRAYQTALDRYVAIKELRPPGDLLDEHAERFRREAHSIAHLDHPNILPVYDFYQEGGRAYIVMKYAPRGSLADLLDETGQPLDPIKAIKVVILIGRALVYAHLQGTVHRDIKPANVFMGEDDWPLLGDFGLSLSVRDALGQESNMVGTFDYVSPEQAVGASQVDHRSDIYSLGVVLYHLLVGEVPHAKETNLGIRLHKRLTQGVPSPRQRNPRVSERLEYIVLKATALDREGRYQTVEAMVTDLEAELIRETKPADELLAESVRHGTRVLEGLPELTSVRRLPEGIELEADRNLQLAGRAAEAGSLLQPDTSGLTRRFGLKLQLVQRRPGKIEIRGLEVPGGGNPKTEVDLPFSLDELRAVLKLLDVGVFEPGRFKKQYVQALNALGLFHNGRLRSDFHRFVGRRLYNTLFSGQLLAALIEAQRSPPVTCQLCFDPEDVVLTQFPWELIHDGNTYLVVTKGGLELTRYIMSGEPPSPLKVDLPLKVLFISPRPEDNDEKLPAADEAKAILSGLEPLRKRGQVSWKWLDPPTWDSLGKSLNEESFHIVHFDGHGAFALVCPACGEAHYPGTETCVECGANMLDVAPQGYLHFEDDNHRLDRVSTSELRVVLRNSQTRLAVLTACSSGVVKGVSVFNGVAPGLIQACIPAVVGMQSAPPVDAMVKFVGHMYATLAEGGRLPEAVNRGRVAIYRDKPLSWFMPVIYLRSSDNTYGQLFTLVTA